MKLIERTDLMRKLEGLMGTPDIKALMSSAFREIRTFMMDSIGNLENANSISKALKANGNSVSHVTVENHMGYLCEAFLFYKVKRYDIKGEEIPWRNRQCDHVTQSDRGVRLLPQLEKQ